MSDGAKSVTLSCSLAPGCESHKKVLSILGGGFIHPLCSISSYVSLFCTHCYLLVMETLLKGFVNTWFLLVSLKREEMSAVWFIKIHCRLNEVKGMECRRAFFKAYLQLFGGSEKIWETFCPGAEPWRFQIARKCANCCRFIMHFYMSLLPVKLRIFRCCE